MDIAYIEEYQGEGYYLYIVSYWEGGICWGPLRDFRKLEFIEANKQKCLKEMGTWLQRYMSIEEMLTHSYSQIREIGKLLYAS